MKRILLITSVLVLSIASYAADSRQEAVEHRVKWYETIGTISHKYDVPVRDILNFNGLEEKDIKPGIVILIPMGGIDDIPVTDDILPTAPQDSTYTGEPDEFEEPANEPAIRFDSENPMKVSLVLPFDSESGNPAVNYFDFYSGVLMALDSVRVHGMNVVLNVFDCKSADRESIFQDESFVSSDLIVGPVQTGDLSAFASFALEHNIPIISPMDHNAEKLLEGNPYLFQVPASQEIQEENMIEFLNVEGSDRVLVVYDSSMSEQEYVDRITSLLDSRGIAYQKIGYGLLHGRTMSDSLKHQLRGDFNYKVIVASQDDAFAPDIVRNMRVLKLFEIPVQLYCSNRVRNFESIDPDSFFELSAHVCTPYYIDYGSPEVKDFVFRYRALYNTEPTPYSFQGYDIISFFVPNIYNGSDFANSADTKSESLFQSNMHFIRKDENCGWQNSATRNLVYNPDFTISIVR